MTSEYRTQELRQLRWLRSVAIVEATTLLVLVGIAVPLKHLGGHVTAVKIVGPLHGVAFVVYFWTLAQTVAAGRWSKSEIVQMIGGALIPFGGLLTQRTLARRQSDLDRPG